MYKLLALILFVMQVAAQEIVGAYAVNMKTGKILIDENSNTSLIPASCMKIVTTGAALKLLDPESHFETVLEYDGTIDKKGTLHGNLYIRGGGDPTLGSDRFGSSWKEQLTVWAEAIAGLGIRRIEGKIIGDASLWEPPMAVPSWEWEDLGNYYGASASALSFNENFYTVIFKPGEIGTVAKIIRTDPPTSLQFKNEMKTGDADTSCIYGSEYSPVRHLIGMIPAGEKEYAIKGSIPDSAAFCAELLTQTVQAHAISVDQKVLPQKKRISFHTTLSPCLREIIYWVNQKSVNLYAEHLVKKIGNGSLQSGIGAIKIFWKSQGIDLDGFNMADGSGLSRKNLATPQQLVAMLVKMKESNLFLESLPKRNDIVRGKSGTMSLVKCYTGYSGDIAFAIMVNQHTNTQKANDKIDAYLTKLTY